ncbi:MAG TPA: MATE family efflux transporter [Polyangiales bacterium]|nr:MATE family efflux transporter [Polyangiales bacterium]
MRAPPKPSTLQALLKLAWPVVLARATQSVIGFADAIMVAPLGEDAMAAAITGNLNAFSFIIFPMGTAFIVQSFTAQLRGRGELEAAPRYATYGLALAVLAGLVALAAIPFLPRIVGALEYSPAVASLMQQYLAIRLLSVAPAVATEALGQWFGGMGNTGPEMIAGVIAMLTNVLLCYLLIEPRFGLPGYGVAGSAWAAVIATTLGFFVIVTIYTRRARWSFDFRMPEFLRLLRFGAPNGMNWFLEFTAFTLFINLVVGHLGTSTLAAFNAVLQLMNVSFMPSFGLASAGAILAGEAIGRRALDEVWPTVRLTTLLASGFMLTLSTLYALFATPLMTLFEPPGAGGARFLEASVQMLMFVPLWQVADAVAITFGETLRAAGDTTWPMVVRIALAWLVFTPIAWFLVRYADGGIPTVMLSLIVYVAILAALLGGRYAYGKWRLINLVGPVVTPR